MQAIFGHFLQDGVIVVITSQTLLVMIGLVKGVGVLLVQGFFLEKNAKGG